MMTFELLHVELEHNDLESTDREHALAFDDASVAVDAHDIEPLLWIFARKRRLRAHPVEVDADAIASGAGSG